MSYSVRISRRISFSKRNREPNGFAALKRPQPNECWLFTVHFKSMLAFFQQNNSYREASGHRKGIGDMGIQPDPPVTSYVEYSPENPSARAYHRLGVPCGAKPERTPFTWKAVPREQAQNEGYKQCRRCSGTLGRLGATGFGSIRTPFGRIRL